MADSIVIRLLAMKWTYPALRVVGYGFLATYLIVFRDFTFSIPWVFGYVAIAVSVATLMVVLKLPERFPTLERYHFARKAPNAEQPRTHEEWKKKHEEWDKKRWDYHVARFRLGIIVHTPHEDGLICVPVLLAGINPLSAIIGGLVFGFFHLKGYTYLDCMTKAITYSLVCLIVLPHGLLTVVAGHFLIDVFAWLGLQAIVKLKAKKELGKQAG